MKGFTEWTNVGKARPLFPRTLSAKVPADLGYYDLRVPETRKAQADMAKEYGIEGFCYWHYWFGNWKETLKSARLMKYCLLMNRIFLFVWLGLMSHGGAFITA